MAWFHHNLLRLTVWKALFVLRYTQPKKTELPSFGAYILEDGFSTKYEARLVVLKLLHGSESPPGLVKIQIFGPHPQLLTQEAWSRAWGFSFLTCCGAGEDSLRVPRTARRSKQSILKEINPDYSPEGLMLKLRWEEPTHWERSWCWERLTARGEQGDRWWGGWMASLTHWAWGWANSWK